MAENYDLGDEVPEKPSNRAFKLVALGLAAVLILSVACIAFYLKVWVPRQQAEIENAQATEAAEVNFQNTQLAQAETRTAQPSTATPTRASTQTPLPSTSTNTPVVVQITSTAETTIAAPDMTSTAAEMETRTAVADASATALAQAQQITPTATALPATGFADENGLPGMVIIAAVLIGLVLAVRRLRIHVEGS
jgi:cytoskeletal protein RodZ